MGTAKMQQSTMYRRIIHSVLQTWKSFGGQTAIGWQAGMSACESIADRSPRDFRVLNAVDNPPL